MARVAVVITAPADSWTPPAGVRQLDLLGLGWHIAHSAIDSPTKREAAVAIHSAGLSWRLRTRTDEEAGRVALREILDEDIALVIRGWAQGSITGAEAQAAATAYDDALTWLEGRAT